MEKTMTLSEKEHALRDTIAMPEASDWQLQMESPESEQWLINELNRHLDYVLTEARNGIYASMDDLAQAVYAPIDELEKLYPNVGLTDRECYQTIARFFAVNYDPAVYTFLMLATPQFRRASTRGG